jgi:hypothetical protein
MVVSVGGSITWTAVDNYKGILLIIIAMPLIDLRLFQSNAILRQSVAGKGRGRG